MHHSRLNNIMRNLHADAGETPALPGRLISFLTF